MKMGYISAEHHPWKVSCQSNSCDPSFSLSWRAAVGMPKKFQGENSKAATARARKAEAKAVADACKKQQEEDALWQETDKHVLKKEQRKVSWNFLVLLLTLASRSCCFDEVSSLSHFFCCCLDDVFTFSWNKSNTNRERKINACKHKTKMLAEQEGNLDYNALFDLDKNPARGLLFVTRTHPQI